jgi:hypothetical protein
MKHMNCLAGGAKNYQGCKKKNRKAGHPVKLVKGE